MRLGFHYHIPAQMKGGGVYLTGHLGRFIDSLAERCETVTCFLHSPLPHEVSQAQYRIQSPNVELVDLGPHSSVPKRILSTPRVIRTVRQMQNHMDCMLIRGPSPLLPDIAAVCEPLPVALLLVGDQLAGIDDLNQPRSRKEAMRLFWRWNMQRQLNIARNNLTFVNSHLLHEQLRDTVPNLVETRTTTLSEIDVFVREDTCKKPPYHILYTGRMDRTKGILEGLEAIGMLITQGMNLIYDLVGPEEKADSVIRDVMIRVEELGIKDRVIYHGYKPVGSELFNFYKTSDIYLIGSQTSEGFPRTIWEAMAHSLPVIATSVGSIPDYVGDAAEIIEPKNVNAIAQAILRILNNPARRQYMIRTGRELARENTLEKRSSEMIAILEEYIEKKRINAGKTKN